MTFFALVRKRPIDLMSSRTRSSPSASIFSGVSASAKSFGVALLTPASVACAESTTATRKVKALSETSSPFGSGSRASKRANISSTAAFGIGRARRRGGFGGISASAARSAFPAPATICADFSGGAAFALIEACLD